MLQKHAAGGVSFIGRTVERTKQTNKGENKGLNEEERKGKKPKRATRVSQGKFVPQSYQSPTRSQRGSRNKSTGSSFLKHLSLLKAPKCPRSGSTSPGGRLMPPTSKSHQSWLKKPEEMRKRGSSKRRKSLISNTNKSSTLANYRNVAYL